MSDVRKLLLILVTLPVTTATPERTFSTFLRLKTYLRNTTEKYRTGGLPYANLTSFVTRVPFFQKQISRLKKVPDSNLLFFFFFVNIEFDKNKFMIRIIIWVTSGHWQKLVF